jgi:hypothetical protein
MAAEEAVRPFSQCQVAGAGVVELVGMQRAVAAVAKLLI